MAGLPVLTLTEIKQLLAAHNLRPLKQLGQNFLFDPNLCRWILDRVEVAPGAPVIEIGPGLGALTEGLLERGHHLTVLEIDKGLAALLRQRHGERSNFRLVAGDALETLPLQPSADAVIGNLPYNISTPLAVTLACLPEPPPFALFTLQKETGRRFAANHGTPDYGAVTILLQTFYQIEILRTLPGGVFHPEPHVESVVVRFRRRPEAPAWSPDQRRAFYELLRRAFSQRRKKLRNTLGWDSDLRPQQLSPADWLREFSEHLA